MASWPTTGNVYPVSPKAYPASPQAYPGGGGAYFPASDTSWPAIHASVTPFWFDPSRQSSAQGTTITSLPNLGDTTRLAQVVASGAGRQIQQIRGLKALKYLRTSIQTVGNPFLSGTVSVPFYTFFVHCRNEPTTNGTIIGGAPASADTYRIRATSTTYPGGNSAFGSSTLTKASTTTAGQPRAVMVKHNGASSIIRTNGFSDTTGNTGSVAITGLGFGIDSGGSNTYGGCIGEAFIVLGSLTAQEEADALAYLETKWKTTAAAKTIMPRGDSNTNGFNTTVTDAAYRGEMDRWGQTAPGGYYIDFMGPVQYSFLANSNHCGYNGATIVDHRDGSVPLNMSTPAQLVTAGYTPTLSILNIGINDANNSAPDISATMLTNYGQLLDAIIAAAPTEKIICCTLNQSQTAGTNTNINGFNAGLPALVSARSANCIFADTGGALGANPGSSGYFSDNLHLSIAGQSKFLDVLKPIILANW